MVIQFIRLGLREETEYNSLSSCKDSRVCCSAASAISVQLLIKRLEKLSMIVNRALSDFTLAMRTEPGRRLLKQRICGQPVHCFIGS
jgi:hypothetical protein